MRALSRWKKLLLTASWDKTARLWDVESGKQIGVLSGHEDRVTSAALSNVYQRSCILFHWLHG